MSTNYPYLPEGHTILYVPITDIFMDQTRSVALELSTDSKQPTGALIVREGKVIGRGANQSILRKKWMHYFHGYLCIRKLLKIKSGTKYYLCPGCASSDKHSEVRAIKDAQNKHNDISGSDLYHWGHWWCCKPCWDSMIKAGIKNVYLVEGATEQFKR